MTREAQTQKQKEYSQREVKLEYTVDHLPYYRVDLGSEYKQAAARGKGIARFHRTDRAQLSRNRC